MSLEWKELKARVAGCTDCPLHAKRNKTVFGVGDENADWLFVGEGPGADEDGLSRRRDVAQQRKVRDVS